MCENSNTVINDEQTNNEPMADEITKPKLFEITRRDTVFAALLFLASLIMSAFGVFGGFNGGFTLSGIILTMVMSLYLKLRKRKIGVFPLVCLILSTTVSLGFLFTTNGSVKFWGFILYCLLTLIWLVSLTRDEQKKGELQILGFIFKPFVKESLTNISPSLRSLFSNNSNRNRTVLKVLLGIAISLPALLIIVPILMSSDEAFSGMVNLIFDNILLTFVKLLSGAVIFVFVLSFAFSLNKNAASKSKELTFNGIDTIVPISFLSVLSICYLGYLFSQLAYFFGAFKGFLPEGYKFNVATYARRGFFEMTVISVINFAIIFTVLLICKKNNNKLGISLTAISTFIGAFTLIIISTALSKMFLYITSFGMTTLRITTSAFMLFLFIVFITLIIRLYSAKIGVIKTALIAAAVTLTLLGVFNVNSVVASYNYNAYINNTLEEIDVETISQLGDDGIPVLIKLAKNKNSEISNSAKLKLSKIYNEYYVIEAADYGKVNYTRKYTGLGALSIPRIRAYAELDSYLKNNHDILNYADEYYEDAIIYPDNYYSYY